MSTSPHFPQSPHHAAGATAFHSGSVSRWASLAYTGLSLTRLGLRLQSLVWTLALAMALVACSAGGSSAEKEATAAPKSSETQARETLSPPESQPSPAATLNVADNTSPTQTSQTGQTEPVSTETATPGVTNQPAAVPQDTPSPTSTSAPEDDPEVPSDSYGLHAENIHQLVPLGRLTTSPVGFINHLTWSADGTHLALAGSTRVCVYASAGLETEWCLDQGSNAHYAVYDPEGSTLAVLFYDSASGYTAALFDAASGETLKRLELGAYGSFGVMAFNADGSQLAVGRDNDIKVWQISSGGSRSLEQVYGFDAIKALAFSADGQWLLAGGADGTLQAWDLRSGDRKRNFLPSDLDEPSGFCTGVGSSGGLLDLVCDVSTEKDGARAWIWQWDVNSGGKDQRLFKIELPGNWGMLDDYTTSPDGARFAYRSRNGMIEIWNLTGSIPKIERSLIGTANTTSSSSEAVHLSFQPNGTLLAVSWSTGQVQLWDTANGQLMVDMEETTARINSLAISQMEKGYLIAASRADDRVDLWSVPGKIEPGSSLENGQRLRSFTIEASFNNKPIALSADGRWLAAANGIYGDFLIWDLTKEGDAPHFSLKPPNAAWGTTCNDLSFSPDGARLAIGLSDGKIYLWETASGALLLKINAGNAALTRLVFNPDGTRLASLSANYVAQVWDAASGKQIYQLSQPANGYWPGYDLAFSPDGSMLAVSSYDPDAYTPETIRLWEVETGKLIDWGFDQWGSLVFLPDQCGLIDGSILRPLADLQARVVIPGWDQYQVDPIHITPDGWLMITSGDDGSIMLWGLPGLLEIVAADGPGAPARLSCAQRYAPTVTPTPRPTPTRTATVPTTPPPTPTITQTPTPAPTRTTTPTPTLPPFTRTLYLTTPHLQGDDVLLVQLRLVELGYTEVGAPDGDFGAMTEAAVKHFQKLNDLDDDGVVGPKTWEKLFSPEAVRAE